LKLALHVRIEVDLNDPAVFDVIQQFLCVMPGVCRYFGPIPIRLRSVGETLT
jgi:hypothetical protein